jgi:hypothetical protein
MRVKVITETNVVNFEIKIQNFLDNPEGLDDNQPLIIDHIKYSSNVFSSDGMIQYSVVIVYNGNNRRK